MRGRCNRTSYARVYGIYDKHCSIMVGLDTHDLGVKRKKRKIRASGRRAVKLAFTRKRNASKRRRIRCFPLSAFSVGYRANVVNVYDVSTKREKRNEGKENRTIVLSLKRISDSLHVNNNAMNGKR